MDWNQAALFIITQSGTILAFVWYLRGWRSTTDKNVEDIDKVGKDVKLHNDRLRKLEDEGLKSHFLHKSIVDQLTMLSDRFDVWQKNNMETHKATAMVMTSNNDQNTKVQTELMKLISAIQQRNSELNDVIVKLKSN